jgi:hypothetical protein
VVNADDIRKWAANHRAAAAREAAELRAHPLAPAEAFASALALLRYDESLNGSPFERNDPVSAREDREMWEACEASRAMAPWPLTQSSSRRSVRSWERWTKSPRRP